MKKLVIGILAHVDAGKTTLAEGMLYVSGKTGRLGRVDNKDAYLDTYELERARGITIFSKQAMLEIEDTSIILLDTPGHVDFSAEMERTLQVLDYAILVISGADGVQGHTKTLWRLLKTYRIPVFLFINKMDQHGTDKHRLIKELKKQLDDGCIEFGGFKPDDFYEQLAMCEEAMLEDFLKTGYVEEPHVKKAVKERRVFPCFFGSALKLDGVEQFMQGIVRYSEMPSYRDQFAAKIFKIARDEQGNRLTYMKVTGARLKVRDALTGVFKNEVWEEKVNQIRIYSGQKFEAVNEVEAGSVCAVTGLSHTRPGEGLGAEKASEAPLLEPVLSYKLVLPDGCDPRVMLPKLRQIEEEEPELHVVWDEQMQEIQVQIMGEVQVEILMSIIKSRFGVVVGLDEGRIMYKETIAGTVEGVGHFEPLRHYAEVHLLLEQGGRGSGLQFGVQCSEDILGKSWQRLVLTHLEEKAHKGVLTGSAITDMKITLVSGRAHNKHTEGGDFREATYRAVRQGLKEASSVLLEPYYDFQLELPEKMVGRAMSDIDKMHGTCQISQTDGESVVLTGSAPVVTMKNYQKDVAAYTKGFGKLFTSFKGYEPCHNAAEVIESIAYDSERDPENPTGSVFCTHGSGFLVAWDEVKSHMHVESYLVQKNGIEEEEAARCASHAEERWISLDEIDKIINNTSYSNQGRKSAWKKRKTALDSYYQRSDYIDDQKEIKKEYTRKGEHIRKEEYLLVDGYNIIYAWPELNALTDDNMDGARIKLLDALCNYQGIRKCRIIVVFDAYRVEGHLEEASDYHNIHVVYTKEAQTADQYIEKFAHDNQKKYNIAVATSDGVQQIIIRGAGSALLSARDLKAEVERARARIKMEYEESRKIDRSYLEDALSPEAKRHMEKMTEKENDK